MKATAALRHQRRRLPPWTRYLLPGAAGLLVGFAGLWFPEVMGAGYDAIDSALHNRFPWSLLLVLGLVKIVVTLVCFSAGTPGGMFAPTLFAGAMIGGALGSIAQHLQLFPTSPTDAYVLVGMGTFFAGVFRAPLTSVFMVFEVSANYVIIAPVLIANTIAYLIVRRLQRVPFFQMVAIDEGLDLPSVEAERETRRLKVEDAMQPAQAVFGPRTRLSTAIELLRQTGDDFRLVKTGHGEWSWVCRDELEQAAGDRDSNALLEEVIEHPPAPRLYPDIALDNALKMVGGHPILPVSSRANRNDLVGTITLEDIHRVYGITPTEVPRSTEGRPRSRAD